MSIKQNVIKDFGDEWSRFDQSGLSQQELHDTFERYFSRMPWSKLPPGAAGFDLGCGSGRWAKLVAPRVGHLHCIDPSQALDVARRNLAGLDNVEFHQAEVDAIPLAEDSMDFGYSLGVLHHIEDTAGGLRQCVRRLKPGAPFLLYLYYRFDNRPWWFRQVWKVSDRVRGSIAGLPFRAKSLACDAIAASVYFPLARGAALAERLGANVDHVPLSFYRDKTFYAMRTDALDRFGTKLEKRYTRDEVRALMESCGLERVEFNDFAPFWTAVGWRRS